MICSQMGTMHCESLANTRNRRCHNSFPSYPGVKQYVDMTTLSALGISEDFHSQMAHEISENIQPWLLILQVQRQKKLRESNAAPANRQTKPGRWISMFLSPFHIIAHVFLQFCFIGLPNSFRIGLLYYDNLVFMALKANKRSPGKLQLLDWIVSASELVSLDLGRCSTYTCPHQAYKYLVTVDFVEIPPWTP